MDGRVKSVLDLIIIQMNGICNREVNKTGMLSFELKPNKKSRFPKKAIWKVVYFFYYTCFSL